MSNRQELVYAQNLRAAIEDSTFTPAWTHLAVILLFIAMAIGWANFAIIEEVTVSSGKVIPSQ